MPDEVTAVAQGDKLKADFKVFGHCLCDKWQAICQRSLLSEISGPNGLWKQAIILDPFLKSSQSQSLGTYTQLFELVTDLSSIENEFQMYLLEPQLNNPEITTGVVLYSYTLSYHKLLYNFFALAQEVLMLSAVSVS